MVHSLQVFAEALEKFGIHQRLDYTEKVVDNHIRAIQRLSYIANGEFPRKDTAVPHRPIQNPGAVL